MDRAIEGANIKPDPQLKFLQNSETLVAVNERIEEAQNYRKELKDFENQEAERVELLRQKNSEKQRKTLQKGQRKEMDQLEAKIDTGRHNLKILMDKELTVLQKQINLHVHDIERIQGFVSNLANKKGNTRDELLRDKERSRKTMEQLKRSKQVIESALDDESAKKTSGLLGNNTTTLNTPFVEGSPVDILLFGQRKTANSYNTSFGQTGTSEQNMGQAQVVQGLKHIIRVCNITTFAISTTGPDGSRLYTLEKMKDRKSVV